MFLYGIILSKKNVKINNTDIQYIYSEIINLKYYKNYLKNNFVNK